MNDSTMQDIMNVPRAFEILIASLKAEEKKIDNAGSQAFLRSDYTAVDANNKRALAIKSLYEKLLAIQQEWEILLPTSEVANEENGLVSNRDNVQIASISDENLTRNYKPEPKANSIQTSSYSAYPSISYLASHSRFSNKDVKAVILPDNTEIAVKTWTDAAIKIAEWSFKQFGLPKLPFRHGKTEQTKRYFLNYEPIHPDGEPFDKSSKYGTIEVKGPKIYVYTKFNAHDWCKNLVKLMNTIACDPSKIRIRMS